MSTRRHFFLLPKVSPPFEFAWTDEDDNAQEHVIRAGQMIVFDAIRLDDRVHRALEQGTIARIHPRMLPSLRIADEDVIQLLPQWVDEDGAAIVDEHGYPILV